MIHLEAIHHSRHEGRGARRLLDRLEQAGLKDHEVQLLRRRLQQRQRGEQTTLKCARQAAQVLQRVWIFLLRHDAAGASVSIG